MDLKDYKESVNFKVITYSAYDKKMNQIYHYDFLEEKAYKKAVNRYEIQQTVDCWQVFDKRKGVHVGSKFQELEECNKELEFYIHRSVYIELEDYTISGETLGEAQTGYRCFDNINVNFAQRCGFSVIEFIKGELDGERYMVSHDDEMGDYKLLAYNVLANNTIDDKGLILSNDTPEMCCLNTVMDSIAFNIIFESICEYKIVTRIATEWDIEKQYKVLESKVLLKGIIHLTAW